ncbi:MAG: ABC transporter ATP-binding protein [Marinobacter sp.]|uniref:ABC transporter ATP-binding protein n=1 Tax=Marinobacter sp. TaxID=50741 RepID=UPI0029C1BE31|nr:ABC transporter ATP-binding protein [Marinobacter sp.]MDX5336625.1 ABC transporter ATP-binding protein [Marinobacter sp.]MDX5387773.1 ABC transporter ATP-binding protein [Marinobacter sp.]MDX5440674.1 ABC transporter ATP-binding protein [Alteromonadaceae bacterium]MDX5473074.1 ABC transporter ATP-binding protein [Marinobacter sp.]
MSIYQQSPTYNDQLENGLSGPSLMLDRVHCQFHGDSVVRDINLHLEAGEVVCLLGPSGCGKTTLLRIAAGLQVPSSGKVFLGRSLVSAPGGVQVPPEKRNVGLAFQESALFPHLTVLENVCFGISTLPKKQKQSRALDLLERLGMAGAANVYPHTLSGGQQQRVALARALAPSPRVMLLDEPFSSLDARLRDQIRDDTLHVLKELNTATLLVTHDPEEAMFMADRIALMRDGEIVQTGSPTELYCNPAEPFVVNFFGQVNEHVGIVHDGQVATPLGRLDASRFDEGANVRILIRPEAVRVTPLEGKVADDRTSHVIMSRLLGPTSLLHICAHGPDGREMHLHAKVPGVFLPEEGQAVSLELDMSQVFLFKAETWR